MKKILIIGAGIEQVPAIKIAKQMGLHVIVSDMTLNAPGVRFSDSAYEISTTDLEGNIEIAKKEKIDGVMTVCSETAVPTVAGVAEKLNLHSYSVDTAIKATNKAEMRKALSVKNINMSPYAVTDNFDEIQEFTQKNKGPWVIKPVDSSGQRGTYIISEKAALQKAFKKSIKFSSTNAVLIDKYIEGPEITVAMQVINKKVHFLAISDRITLDENYFGIAIRHLGPSLIKNKKTEFSIIEICRKSVEAIGLVDGVATCELILDNEIPILLEIAIRVPGGYKREVAMYLSGIDLIKTTIWNCLGEEKTIGEIKTENVYPAVSVKLVTDLNLKGNFKTINTVENIDEVLKMDGIKACNIHFDLPFDIPKLKSSVGRFAAIIGVGENRQDAIDKTEKAFNLLSFNGLPLVEYTNYHTV